MKHIKFKSNPKFYHLEYFGDKNNTVRKIELDDDRLEKLQRMEGMDSDKLEDCIIEIINTETNQSFCRIIKSVVYYDERWIISW